MTKDEIILANKEFLFPSVFHYYKEPLVIARAKDQFVWDADGNQYLDFFGGIVGERRYRNQREREGKQLYTLQHVRPVRQRAQALGKKIADHAGRMTKSFTNRGPRPMKRPFWLRDATPEVRGPPTHHGRWRWR
jgi:acetylornithine/succinyldiaminopimelate/putrescine aminotransferase